MSKYIDVEWTVVHSAQINLEAVKHLYDDFVKTMSPDDALARAINDEIAGLDDGEYYAWTEGASNLVRQAFMREYGIQMSMFEDE